MVQAADTPASFQREVLDADVAVLVDFWAPWCGPCRMVSPEVEAIGRQYADRLKVVKVNVDEHPDAAQRYGVQGIPTLGLFEQGVMVRRIVGARPRQAIVSELGIDRLRPKGGWGPTPGRQGDEARPPVAPPRRPDGRY